MRYFQPRSAGPSQRRLQRRQAGTLQSHRRFRFGIRPDADRSVAWRKLALKRKLGHRVTPFCYRLPGQHGMWHPHCGRCAMEVRHTFMQRDSSVIVSPVRDEVARVGNIVQSVASQTVRPLRWVIVDDGSSDGTDRLLEEHVARLPCLSVVHLWNRGHRAAGGGVMDAFTPAWLSSSTCRGNSSSSSTATSRSRPATSRCGARFGRRCCPAIRSTRKAAHETDSASHSWRSPAP